MGKNGENAEGEKTILNFHVLFIYATVARVPATIWNPGPARHKAKVTSSHERARQKRLAKRAGKVQ